MQIEEIEKKLEKQFKHFENVAFLNQKKVLEALQAEKVSTRHFSGTTGYGYDDIGRDTLARVFARVFNAESAIVSPNITCGSHAIAIVLFGLLRPNDEMLSIAGKPYDTLDETIFGVKNEDRGSLKDLGVKYAQIDLKDDQLNFEEIEKQIKQKQPKVVFLQRSRGYNWRNAISILDIKKCALITKKVSPSSIFVVDNCYGEFIDTLEPTDVGANVIVGSLIKNPGGGLASTGAYIAGDKKFVDMISYRFTSPSLSTEVGSYEKGYREFYQGLFLAPSTVASAVKGAYLIGEVMAQKGYEVMPKSDEIAGDIIKSIKFNDSEKMIKFIQNIQKFSPIDSDAVPTPWDMPGYLDPIIMAAGTFVSGASIELSADGPVKPPYVAYFQGALTYEHAKIVAKALSLEE
ncbi:MAG: methionine gamma-lyase family protein [Clostridia bacterium]|nr:methionine gamma-lyase family protein [Clostridia bacterium]